MGGHTYSVLTQLGGCHTYRGSAQSSEIYQCNSNHLTLLHYAFGKKNIKMRMFRQRAKLRSQTGNLDFSERHNT